MKKIFGRDRLTQEHHVKVYNIIKLSSSSECFTFCILNIYASYLRYDKY